MILKCLISNIELEEEFFMNSLLFVINFNHILLNYYWKNKLNRKITQKNISLLNLFQLLNRHMLYNKENFNPFQKQTKLFTKFEYFNIERYIFKISIQYRYWISILIPTLISGKRKSFVSDKLSIFSYVYCVKNVCWIFFSIQLVCIS